LLAICIAGALSLPAASAVPHGDGSALHGTARLAGSPLANAVVWLDAPGAPRTVSAKRVVLDQRDLAFSPHVLAVRVGTTVDFPNDDRVFHNVFSFRDGKVFNLGLYPVGTSRPVTFDRAGLSRIFCNIHPNMAAYVMAVDTPYFAVSRRDGTFTIADAPPRTYTFHAWRPGGPELSGSWDAAAAPLAVDWP
jgi:plastocyanin